MSRFLFSDVRSDSRLRLLGKDHTLADDAIGSANRFAPARIEVKENREEFRRQGRRDRPAPHVPRKRKRKITTAYNGRGCSQSGNVTLHAYSNISSERHAYTSISEIGRRSWICVQRTRDYQYAAPCLLFHFGDWGNRR